MEDKNNQENYVILHESTVDNGEEKVFSKYITSIRKNVFNDSNEKRMSAPDLAQKLDINYDQFRKMLNYSRPMYRDCIIAIAIILGMDEDETNEAISLYKKDYYRMLDDSDSRDALLIDILNKSYTRSIDEVNDILLTRGFTELNIINHRGLQKKSNKKLDSKYEILKKKSRTAADDILWGDRYDSLSTQYSLYNYRFTGEIFLKRFSDGKIIDLYCDTYNNYYIDTDEDSFIDIESYDSIEKTGDFIPYFTEARSMALKEKKRILSIMNDTKNYKSRVSAKVVNDKRIIFAETYNFTAPELNEYYFLEDMGGKICLRVFRSSEFMRHYMSEEDYSEHYGNKKSCVLVKEYQSIEELEQRVEETGKLLLKTRLRHFKMLKELTDKLLVDLRERKVFINNLNMIYDDPDRVCKYYGVDKEFNCVLDDEGGMMFAQKDSATFSINNNDGHTENIVLTLKELHRAFELGFQDIQQICRVKLELGDIEKILY